MGRIKGDAILLPPPRADASIPFMLVMRTYMDGSSNPVELAINTIRYDGRGRRIVKAVRNSADLDATYHYYYDGDSIVEVQNGSDEVIKQHVWGVMYIDELVQVAAWQEESQHWSEYTPHWAMQDANWNVLGIVDAQGVLVERYEYTPYGERTVFRSAGADDPGLYAPTHLGRRGVLLDGGVPILSYPWALCDIGHQGLMLDEETGNYDNRARIYIPRFARFGQQDPLGYVDGMNLYEYVRSSPVSNSDPQGLNCCGPDITSLLNDIDREVTRQFHRLSAGQQNQLCELGAFLWPMTSWDIFQLAQRSVENAQCGRGTGSCQETVTINGTCHRQEEVNYYLWGMMGRLCDHSPQRLAAWVRIHRLFRDRSGRMWWTEAGYYGDPDHALDGEPQCTPCNYPARQLGGFWSGGRARIDFQVWN